MTPKIQSTLVGAVAATMLLMGTAHGQTDAGASAAHEESNIRLSLAASLDNTWTFTEDGYDDDGRTRQVSTIALLKVGVEYFVADSFSLGIFPMIGAYYFESGGNDNTTWFGSLDGQARLYFAGDSGLVPYIGALIGYQTQQDSEGLFETHEGTLGGLIGLEYMISDFTSAFVEYNGVFGVGTTKYSFAGTSTSSSSTSWTNRGLVGLSHYF